VLLQNPPDFNNVTVDGSADPAPTNATLALSADGTKGRIIGLSVGEIDYATGDTSAVDVKTGTAAAGSTGLITVANTMSSHLTTLDVGGGEYTVKVLATNAVTPTTNALTVNAGPGRDQVILGSTARSVSSIQGAVTVNGRGPFQSETAPPPATLMFVEDAGGPAGTVYSFRGSTNPPGGFTVFRSGAAPMTLFNASLAVDYAQNPGFAPARRGSAAPRGPVLNVEGIPAGIAVTLHGDHTHATVNLGNAAGSLDDLHGSLTLTGQGGSADLFVHDQGSKAAGVYTLGAGTFARSGAGQITSDLPGTLVVDGGAGGNRFDVEGLAAGHPTTINAGRGGDLVRMRGGAVRSPLSINGTGNTRLGYAAYTTGVYANLLTGVATDVASLHGVHSLTGGQGDNILVGGPGDELIAGPGRNLLIGAGGHDHLVGGSGQDILIGGHTAYDDNRAALMAIMAEWGRTDLGYTERVDRLLKGEGVPALNARAVFAGEAGDVLTGGKGRDLFFASLGDVLHHRKSNEVVVPLAGK
jgi:Ca2+-binding RTX toxin-like protein